MKPAWPQAKLGDVLVHYQEYIENPEPRIYPKLSVKLYGKGVVLDLPADGTFLKMQRHQIAKAGQVILSEIWGKKGAIGFVPKEGEGALCTSHFFLFEVNRERLEPGYLNLIFAANYLEEQLNSNARGTTGYAAVRPKNLLSATIPLPPLPEQRRIVARIEELSAKIEEARSLRHRTIEESEALLGARFGVVFSEIAMHHPIFPLGSLASHVLDGPHQTPQYVSQGVPFVTVKNMVTGKLILNDLNYVTASDHKLFSKRCRAEKGDILYSKDGATRGRPCLVDTDREFSFFVSVALIKPLRDRLAGPYLVHLLNSNWIKDLMKDKSRGDMIPHIVLKEIKAFPIPLPNLTEQRRIVAYLDDLQVKVESVKKLQEESEAELNALMPSILSRAFSGKLL